MLGSLLNNPISFLFWLAALIVAITIHEFSHAYAADRLGDPTPAAHGRLTLNPLAHLDPIGTLMLLIARFGWGKPVPIDPYNLRNPVRDSAIISLAGPASNLILAGILAVLYHLLSNTAFTFTSATSFIFVITLIKAFLIPVITINVILAIFNLLPVHPLDGFSIVRGILPPDYARQWQELEPYGMIFLIFLIFPFFGGASPVSQIISPVINTILSILIPQTPLI